ncbi:RICIN domain-containing protein [Cellulomonas sp. HZM]|uniref:RICIN domain-containing protein n=1 Tax=Cellulomonas sp. HZM TaxID=1454010 RepID=UPI000493348F|nr:RICIN domain-containing protein [Cellulomonas sp. HZM]
MTRRVDAHRGHTPARRRALAAALAVCALVASGALRQVSPTSAAWQDPAYASGQVVSATGPVLDGRRGTAAYVAADTSDAGTAVDLASGTSLTGLQPGASQTIQLGLKNSAASPVAVSAPTTSMSTSGGLTGSCAITTTVSAASSTSLAAGAAATATATVAVPSGLLPTCWNRTGTFLARWDASMTGSTWVNPAWFRGEISLGTWVWYGQVKLNGTSLCLDVVSRLNDDGTGVQVYDCNKTPAQVWTFNPNGTVKVYQSVGQWNATDNPTPRCLDINASSQANDVQMQIWSCGTSQANQTWRLVDNGDGTVRVVSALQTTGGKDRCLDVPSSSLTSGTRARVYDCTAANRSRSWVLSTVSPVAY